MTIEDHGPDRAVPLRRPIPALPATTQGLMALRTAKRNRTILDYVEDHHVSLWEDNEYRTLLDAVFNADALEGSLNANHYAAAGIIREHARSQDDTGIVAVASLESIKTALRFVMRRYNINPKQRRAAYLAGPDPEAGNDGGVAEAAE